MSAAADTLARRAEVLKLARILERDPAELDYLEALSLADLRTLRDQATDVLYSAHDATLKRLAAASRLLPTGVTATIAQRAFGPLLAARMTGLLDPERAVEIAAKLPTEFLADVATELDPRRAAAVLALIAPEQVADISRVLGERGEHVTMGRFVGHMSDDGIRAALGTMDNATLLRVGFVLEDKGRLERLLALLAPGRMGEIIRAAAREGLWLEALDLLSHLPADQQDEVVAGAAGLDDPVLQDIIATVIEHDLWVEVLIVARRDAALQAMLAARVPDLPAAQRRELARQVRTRDARERLGVLGDALSRR